LNNQIISPGAQSLAGFYYMEKFNFKDEQDFQSVKSEAEVFYKSLGPIHCPYFNEGVIFNSKGWRHLGFRDENHIRPQADQYARLKLLKSVPEVIKSSHTIQGIWQTKVFEPLKTDITNSIWSKVLKNSCFYEFIAVLNLIRLKVIVKQIETGEKYFWSVIPYWGIDKHNGMRILHSGNLESE
jgi:hypothetical protein